MADSCFDTKLLKYSGTSQGERSLPALDGKYATVDERTTADLILFTKKFGAYLNYYEITNSITGTWENLMGKDVSVAIADIADWRTKDYTSFLAYVNSKITNAATDAEAKKYFKVIFDFVFSIADNLTKSLNLLPEDLGYSKFLKVSISSNLGFSLDVLYQYYEDFKVTLIDETSVFVDPQMPVNNVVLSQNFKYSATGPAVPAITLTGSVKDDIYHIITHNLFTGPLEAFKNGVISLVSKTPAYLEETLKQYSSHQPHYALFLAFLRLFRYAQDHLNDYTKSHLDFYYKDVLLLTNKAAVPDFVHLIFELQKNADAHLLTKGTSFKAGKDDKNNDLFYALTDSIVVQKAQVQSLKSLYLEKSTTVKDLYTLYASPVANSEDGNGAKLLSADNSWFPFGNGTKISPAKIGFAIASNVLYMNEGERVVELTFQCESLAGILPQDFSGVFTIQFTGKKNWYTANSYSSAVSGTTFTLSVTLPGDAPAIVPYSQKIHSGSFTEALPMVQVLLTSYTTYKTIKALRISTVSVTVNATVKNLSLQNDDGRIDPAKPFKLFGEFPDIGASVIIGSKEVFQKQLTSLTINLEWQNGLYLLLANVLALSKGTWSNPFGNGFVISAQTIIQQTAAMSSELVVEEDDLFFSVPSSVTISGLSNVPKSTADFTANEDYNVTSIDAFIKLEITNDNYNLANYLASLPQPSVTIQYEDAAHTIVKGYTTNTATPSPPDPPLAKSISLSYTATDTISPAEGSFLYHIEPFGFREMDFLSTTDPITFLPVFNMDNGTANDNGGELWIGLNNAVPGQNISMLFEVSDGSANPLKNMTKVDWYYLAKNNWLKFDNVSITDQTNNLTRSGLVVINLPDAITSSNVRADAGLLWIKAVTDHDTDALCKLIAVRTNAAKATFVQDLTKNVEFTKPLAPGIISKPVIPDGAIKKTEQPYPSFDGRIRETDEGFYIRVSERLRHKQRAITQWDYERLVLQNFPQIHKVKCINHTGFIVSENTNTQKYSELLPSHVTVIAIPDLSHVTAADKLHPYTSIGLLTEIQQYLQNYTSPFVKLHVCNPQFEEVQFDFDVTFYPEYEPVFYSNLLNDEIEQFLTPWANQNGNDIEFGGKIEKSVVLNFIEERYYVDFVTCFKMHQIINRTSDIIINGSNDIEEAVASTARSILVSYSNETTKERHLIHSPANCNCNA